MFVAGGFFPARFSVHVPLLEGFQQAAVPTFKKGYPVVTTNGLVDECGANPALIAGVALADNSTTPGYSAANSPSVITGQYTGASIALANQATEFNGRLVNNSDVTVAPTAADIGAKYGISKQASGWAVDKNLTAGNARTIITGIDTVNNRILFKFLVANQQYNA